MDTDLAAYIQLPRHEEDTRKNYIYWSKQKIAGICHDSCKTNLSRFIQNKTATSSVISELLMNICSPKIYGAVCPRQLFFKSHVPVVRMHYDPIPYVRLE